MDSLIPTLRSICLLPGSDWNGKSSYCPGIRALPEPHGIVQPIFGERAQAIDRDDPGMFEPTGDLLRLSKTHACIAAINWSRVMKSICKAMMPKSRFRSAE